MSTNNSVKMVKREKIDYKEKDIELGLSIYNQVKDKIEFLLYIQEQRQTKFSLILIDTNKENFENYIKDKKRDTDLYININGEENVHMVICQETDVYGGHQFLERIFTPFKEDETICSCASILEISKSPGNKVKTTQIIFKLLDNFLSLTTQPAAWKKCQILYKTLNV